MKIKIANKGYTVTVVSWENDGDYYAKKSVTYQNKDEAIAIRNMCNTLFKSKNSNPAGIGNSSGDHSDLIINYFKTNPILLKNIPEGEYDLDDCILDLCHDYVSDLMGHSEWYSFRVCESATLTYLENDVFADKIE